MTEPKPAADRPRRSQAERRRRSEQRLIQTALSIAAEQGVCAVTFEALAQQSGYSRGLPSQKFGSKAGLLRCVIDHLHRARDRALAARGLDERDGLDALSTYVSVYFESLATPELQAYFRFLGAAVADGSEQRALFADAQERAREQLSGVFERGQADGSLRTGIDASTAAVMLGSLLTGVAIQHLADPDTDLDSLDREIRGALHASFAARRG